MKKINIIFLILIIVACFSCSKNDNIFEEQVDEDKEYYQSYFMIDEFIKKRVINNYEFLNGNYIPSSNNCSIIEPLLFPLDLCVSSRDIYFSVHFFDKSIASKFTFIEQETMKNEIVIPKNTYFGMTFFGDLDLIQQLKFDFLTDYYVDENMEVNEIYVEKIGEIKGLQSFCYYNNNYYSTSGNIIYVQDDSFSIINTLSINVGHANSFQSINTGDAFISGWNDNKLYLLNLNSMSLKTTISLPTSGYTTCAVDNCNNIYIFQRESYPDTFISYNFIVYNYIANKIIFSKETSFEMCCQQSCVFFENKLYVTFGLGKNEQYNGFLILDKYANIIASIHLNSLKDVEPEGIYCLSEHELIISFIDGSVYKITY